MKHFGFPKLGLAGLLGGLAVFIASCAEFSGTTMLPPRVPGAKFVGNNTCKECHAAQFKTFAGSIHSRVHVEDTSLAGGTSCESCHGPGSEHFRTGGGRQFIVNPGKDPSSCFQCHQDVHAQFNLPQHHPVVEGKMNCAQCHDPHGTDIAKPAGGLAMARLNENCAQCHKEQTRLVIFEHQAMREGCAVCHDPHGSINAKLLNTRDNNLCLKCHAQVQTVSGAIFIGKSSHTTYLQRGSCWTSGCHTAVHGSNIDSRLLY